MIQTLDQVAAQISRTDQQLQYYLILEQQETNRLLRELLGKSEKSTESEKKDELDSLKRPELMKRMAKLENKPPGWNTWDNKSIIKHLKGESV